MRIVRVLSIFAFNALIVCFTAPVYFLSLFSLLLRPCVPQSRQDAFKGAAARLLIIAIHLAWRAVFVLSFWIRVHVYGLNEFRTSLGSCRSSGILVMNHTSFLDVLLAVSFAPLHRAADVKVLIANKLLNIPFLSQIIEAQGHLTVPFKSQHLEDMSVENDKMDLNLKLMEHHLRQGRISSWFPEGVMNRSDQPLQLGKFRARGFRVATRVDTEVWCIASVGIAGCWSPRSPVGGMPAHMACRIFKLCDSSFSFLQESGMSSADERDQCIFLADATKSRIQAAVDELASHGFNAAGEAPPLRPKQE